MAIVNYGLPGEHVKEPAKLSSSSDPFTETCSKECNRALLSESYLVWRE